MNLAKKDLMYSKGMKISLHSKLSSHGKWFRGGEDIQYIQNKFTNSKKPLYILSFSYEFLNDNDTISMAFAEPYTFTEIMQDINKFQRKMSKRHMVIRKPLCTTVGGCNCDMLIVTSTKNGNKKVVVLTARVHPGETVGSWMMKGILTFLASNCSLAESLLNKYIFKIVPCIAPDGVIQGNYRCSLSGFDLNRKYNAPSRILHPVIYYIKQMVKSTNEPIAFYCDLHGHSKKKDIFAYGNTGENPLEYCLFPYILSKINRYFSYKSSKFSVSKSKASTARVAMWKELRIPAVYTIEASFYGPSTENRHFTPEDLMQMGQSICQALIFYSQFKEFGEQNVDNTFTNKIITELKADPETFVNNKDDSESDSNSSVNEADVKDVIEIISPNINNIEEADIDNILMKFIEENHNETITANIENFKEQRKDFTHLKIPIPDIERPKIRSRNKYAIPTKEPSLEMKGNVHPQKQVRYRMQNVSKYLPKEVEDDFAFNISDTPNFKPRNFHIKDTQIIHTRNKEQLLNQSSYKNNNFKEVPKSHSKPQHNTMYKQSIRQTSYKGNKIKRGEIKHSKYRPHEPLTFAEMSEHAKSVTLTFDNNDRREVSIFV